MSSSRCRSRPTGLGDLRLRVPLAGDRSLLGDALFDDARSSDLALRRPTDLARRAPRRARRGESLPSDEPRVELLDELIDP